MNNLLITSPSSNAKCVTSWKRKQFGNVTVATETTATAANAPEAGSVPAVPQPDTAAATELLQPTAAEDSCVEPRRQQTP